MAQSRTVADHWNQSTKQVGNNPIRAIRTVSGNGLGGVEITVPSGDLSAAPFTFTTTETEDFKIDYIYFSFSVAITETITLTKTTTGINEVLFAEVVTSANNVRLLSTENVVIRPSVGEQFKIDITNTGTSGLVDVVLKKEVI